MAVVAVTACAALSQEPAADGQPQVIPVQRTFNELLSIAPASGRRSHEDPVVLQLSAGFDVPWLYDPFARAGTESFSRPSAGLSASATGHSWYLEGAGQLLRSSLRERSVWASVRRSVRIVGLQFGFGGEYREMRYRHSVFNLDGGALATDRRLRIGMGVLEFGRGAYNRPHARLSLMTGWYANKYFGILSLSSFEGTSELALDETIITGARLTGARIPLGVLQLHGSLQYMRLVGIHSAFVPSTQWSGTLGVQIRIKTPKKRKGLYLGLEGRFNDTDPQLVPDLSVGVHLHWRIK